MSDWRERHREHDLDRPRHDRDRYERDRRERELRDRRFDEGRSFAGPRGPRGDYPTDYNNPDGGPYAPGGGAAQGYGDGGDSAYGQISRGSSDAAGGGYGGANVGGWGQSGLTSQWGAGGYGPLNTGLEYGQGGGRFGPAGYGEGDFASHRGGYGGPRDAHEHSYRTWRDAQLANHDRDYGRWRDEQTRRYDEDYHTWRNERHSAFSKAFEGWRTGRGGQAAPDADAIHGANPTLSKIAEGHEGRSPQPKGDNGVKTGPDPDRH